jgi:hypothetical protein
MQIKLDKICIRSHRESSLSLSLVIHTVLNGIYVSWQFSTSLSGISKNKKKIAIGYFCASFTLKSNYKTWPTSKAPYPTTNTKHVIKQTSHPYRRTHDVFNCTSDPTRDTASSILRFLDHTQGLKEVGRTPLDEWWARRRDLYLTSHNTRNIRAHGGIRTHNLARRATEDLCIRPHGQCDWQGK